MEKTPSPAVLFPYTSPRSAARRTWPTGSPPGRLAPPTTPSSWTRAKDRPSTAAPTASSAHAKRAHELDATSIVPSSMYRSIPITQRGDHHTHMIFQGLTIFPIRSFSSFSPLDVRNLFSFTTSPDFPPTISCCPDVDRTPQRQDATATARQRGPESMSLRACQRSTTTWRTSDIWKTCTIASETPARPGRSSGSGKGFSNRDPGQGWPVPRRYRQR